MQTVSNAILAKNVQPVNVTNTQSSTQLKTSNLNKTVSPLKNNTDSLTSVSNNHPKLKSTVNTNKLQHTRSEQDTVKDKVKSDIHILQSKLIDHLEAGSTSTKRWFSKGTRSKESFQDRLNNTYGQMGNEGNKQIKVSYGGRDPVSVKSFTRFIQTFSTYHNSVQPDHRLTIDKGGNIITTEKVRGFYGKDARHADQRIALLMLSKMVEEEVDRKDSYLNKHPEAAKVVSDKLTSLNRKLTALDIMTLVSRLKDEHHFPTPELDEMNKVINDINSDKMKTSYLENLLKV